VTTCGSEIWADSAQHSEFERSEETR